ncbi:MAG: hypothetical protein IIV86_04445, partial [Bacteroidaceae bacterium]|nr:hypothetical protein [Bacteroidaceae bacterium]
MMRNILAPLSFIAMMLLVVACQPPVTTDMFSLSCGSALSLKEGDSDIIEVIAGGNYMIETDNRNALCTKEGNHITVKG